MRVQQARLTAAAVPEYNWQTFTIHDGPFLDYLWKNSITINENKPMNKPFSQRISENLDGLLDKIKLHIRGTLDPNYHYVAGGTQTIDTWESRGSLSTTALDTATKYLDRYGKKDGKNPKDLMKAIHYILMVYQKDIVEDDSQRKDN